MTSFAPETAPDELANGQQNSRNTSSTLQGATQ
jgi:hypothetical protein